MDCSSPMRAFCVGINHETGKKLIKIRPYAVEWLEKRGDQYLDHSVPLADMDLRALPPKSYIFSDCDIVPCGKCIGCRLNYSREWADRCLLESLYHDETYFLTVTYDDDHVPWRYGSDPDTGEVSDTPMMSLDKLEFQRWLKRLRQQLVREGKPEIRFFACGEYGPKTFRPHYHAIVFGLQLDDLVQLPESSPLGDPYYKSDWLEKTWHNGSIVVGHASWQTMAYTARYVCKKLDFKPEFYETAGIEPEFLRMSRRPGIGNPIYLDRDLWQYESLNIATQQGAVKIVPGKYYQRLLERDDPDRAAALKEFRRMIAEDRAQLIDSNLSFYEQQQAKGRLIAARAAALPRDRGAQPPSALLPTYKS